MNTTDTGAWLTAKQEMKALAEEVRAHSTIRPSLRSVADRLTQIAAQMPTDAEKEPTDAEKELALIREAAQDASLSDGAVRAIASGTVEPTPDDIAWAQSELRRADPAQEREP